MALVAVEGVSSLSPGRLAFPAFSRGSTDPITMQGQSLGLFVAFSAGLLSFLSPCVLPLVPSYATFITGMSLDELQQGDRARTRRTVLVHGILFVLGFTAVFLAL